MNIEIKIFILKNHLIVEVSYNVTTYCFTESHSWEWERNNNKINVNIAYQYINENSSCELEKIEDCKNSDFVYEIGKVVIENNIITKMDFHR